jgi:hypothetical protein
MVQVAVIDAPVERDRSAAPALRAIADDSGGDRRARARAVGHRPVAGVGHLGATRRGDTMRAILTAAIASSVVGLSCGRRTGRAQSGESTVRRVAVTAATPVFTVDLVHGAITVAGHDAPLHRVRRDADDESAKTDADRAAADREVRLDVVEGPEGATLCASMPYRERCDDPDPWRRGRDRDEQRPGYTVSFDVVAKVPRTTRVVVKTVDGGPLRISDLDGPVDARHGTAASTPPVGAGGRLRTVNGDVRLTLPTNPRTVVGRDGQRRRRRAVRRRIVSRFLDRVGLRPRSSSRSST